MRVVAWPLLLLPLSACMGGGSASPSDATAQLPSVDAACRGAQPDVLRDCVEKERMLEDVRFVAQPRPPGSTHWRSVQTLCAETFAAYGFDVEYQRYGTGINVVGTKRGVEHPSQRVIVGAHYDHIAGCPGADDNATGVAGALELARTLGPATFDRTLVVACWDEEERGLVGSRAYADRAAARHEDVVVYFNFDAIGYARKEAQTQRIPEGFDLIFADEVERLRGREYRADFITAIADEKATVWTRALSEHAAVLELPLAVLEIPTLLRLTPVAFDLHRSDHASFWDVGYPAVMITDTAEFRSERYHCRDGVDDVGSLDAEFFGHVVGATAAAVASALQGRTSLAAGPGGGISRSSQPGH